MRQEAEKKIGRMKRTKEIIESRTKTGPKFFISHPSSRSGKRALSEAFSRE